MEIIPDIKEKVIYRHSFEFRTRFNIKVREFEKKIILKLPNEFKNALKGFNHRNSTIGDYRIDTNQYYL